MFTLSNQRAITSAIIATSFVVSAISPLVAISPSFAQTTFSDVPSGYWAGDFIQALSRQGVVAGFPEGTFRPEEPVTRAQFAAMINKAFPKPALRPAINFNDVPSNYWARSAIAQAYSIGFMSGYPGNNFRPNEAIPRQQVLVALANGLQYTPAGNVDTTLQYYTDASSIADYARIPIAAATEKQIVVNYPNLNSLNPTTTATRAQVAAFIYQALVSSNQVAAINSPYIVGGKSAPVATTITIPAGTIIPVKYEKADRILITKQESTPLTLTTAQNVITQDGTVIIPTGSQVIGQLKPARGGSQFVAQKLILTTGPEYPISASSNVITKTQKISKGSSTSAIVKDTLLGAAAATVVASVTGDRVIATEKVLGGAGIGALVGFFFGKNSAELVDVEPNSDFELTVNQNLVISPK